MRIYYWSTLLVCLLTNLNLLSAQKSAARDTGMNLVPNPSFEELKYYEADKPLEPFMGFRKQMKAWNSPTETTPDLVQYIYSDNYETAHSGDRMIGILTHNPNSKKSDEWREYIQVRLDLELEFDEQYLIEFWVMRHPQSTIASNNIGALLSRIPFSTYDIQPITHLDLAVNKTEIINPGQSEWQKISAVFTAKGDERFLLIGNFFHNEDTEFKDVKNTAEPAWHNPYYLVDDVSIRHLAEPGLDKMKVKKGDVVELNKIYFESNRWNLLEDSFDQLNQLANLMHKHPKMRIQIKGHTDNKGTESYNQKISEHRCESVYNYLMASNVNSRRMEYVGYGETYPIDTNDTEEGRQNNRRVEFVILTVDPVAEAKAAEGILEGED